MKKTSVSENHEIVLNVNDAQEITHVDKEKIPESMRSGNTVMLSISGWGGMTASFNEMPAGTDITPLLTGLKNDRCQCPHQGYVVDGTIKIVYEDDSEDVVKKGEVFYWKPGHTAIVTEDVKLIDFSPEEEFNEVINHIMGKINEAGNA